MGKLSRGYQDQGYFDSGLLPAPLDLVAWLVQEWHRLFPVPAMVHLEFLDKERLLCED